MTQIEIMEPSEEREAATAKGGVEEANKVVIEAIHRREAARVALLEIENVHAEVIGAWLAAYQADAEAVDAIKKAMAVAAALQDKTRSMNYVKDREHGKYGWTRRIDKKVDVGALVSMHPRLVHVHPEIFEVRTKNLDRMVDEGVVTGPNRAACIVEVDGPVIRYVPPYRKGAPKFGGGSEEEEG